MKKKIIILLFLLSFPSVFYVILTTGKTNFIHVNYLGEKKIAENGKDTIYHTVQPFQFSNQNGVIISDKMLEGKIYVADFFSTLDTFASPKMSSEMLRLQGKFISMAENIQLISFVANPEIDTLPVISAYYKLVHADNKIWNFATGSKNELKNLAINGYLMSSLGLETIVNDSIPLNIFVLVDKEKHIRGCYNGTNIKEVNNLIDDLKVLTAEYFIKNEVKKKNDER